MLSPAVVIVIGLAAVSLAAMVTLVGKAPLVTVAPEFVTLSRTA